MPPRPRFDRRAPVRELPNINERIKYPQLRVVDSDGKQLGVIDRLKALEIASQRELDLVLVSEKAIYLFVESWTTVSINLNKKRKLKKQGKNLIKQKLKK